jgi:transcriptional regulator with XRE-family HTH domain
MNAPRNLVGPKVRAIRTKQGLTQPMLVARCQLLGWKLSRETLAKIETQIRWVSDFELLGLAEALRVPVIELLPSDDVLPHTLRRFLGKTYYRRE